MLHGRHPEAAQTTEGTLLDGRVRYAQCTDGYRTGIEPVLLAAAVPARPGQRVLEAGTGAGAGLLCLAARVPGLIGLGLERDPALAMLARRNFMANGRDGVAVAVADAGRAPVPARIDHAFANPPWHAARASASPIAGRDRARRAQPGLPGAWASGLAMTLRHRGTLTLILPAASLSAWMNALAEAGCGAMALLPLWPHMGKPAKLILLQGVKGARGPCRVLPGLVLHHEDGSFTEAAEAVLRHGAALEM